LKWLRNAHREKLKHAIVRLGKLRGNRPPSFRNPIPERDWITGMYEHLPGERQTILTSPKLSEMDGNPYCPVIIPN